MKQFTFSDMNRLSGEILETALIEPVSLTKRGKEKLVIVTADAYRRLLGKPQADAYGLFDAPDHIHRELRNGLDAIINESDENA